MARRISIPAAFSLDYAHFWTLSNRTTITLISICRPVSYNSLYSERSNPPFDGFWRGDAEKEMGSAIPVDWCNGGLPGLAHSAHRTVAGRPLNPAGEYENGEPCPRWRGIQLDQQP